MAYDLNLCLERIYGKSLVFKESSQRWEYYFDACLDRLNWEREHGLLPHHYDRPLGVQLELTDRCNLKCIQCYNDSGPGKSREINREMWLALARELGEMGVFECVISGGEPLLCDFVFDVMDVLHEYDVQFVFITNGWFLDRENIKRLVKYRYNWIQVSMDGFKPETHDYIRGAKGSWKRAVTATKRLCDLGLPVVAACTICRRNLEETGDFIDLCGCLGVSRVVIGEMIPVGRAGANLRDQMLDDEESARMDEVIGEKRQKWGEIFEISVPLPSEIQVKMKALQPNGVLLIRPDGNVRIDCIIPFSVGNLFEDSLTDVWERARLIHFDPNLHQYALDVKDKWHLLESSYGVSYITEDFQPWKADNRVGANKG